MNLLGTPRDDDYPASLLIADIKRVNDLMAAMDRQEWVDVQVGYRLVGADTTFRESVMVQQAPEVPEILSRLAQHVKLAYGQMSVEVLTGNETRQRIITFDIADLLYVEVQSEPHETESDDEQRRRAFRSVI